MHIYPWEINPTPGQLADLTVDLLADVPPSQA